MKKNTKIARVHPDFYDFIKEHDMSFPKVTKEIAFMMNTGELLLPPPVTKRKKGSSPLDILFVIIMLFILAVGLVTIVHASKSVNTQLQTNEGISPEARAEIDKYSGKMPAIIDYTYLIVLVGLSIFLFISAYLVRTHPVFFFILIFLTAFVILIGAALSNAFEVFAASPDLLDTVAQLHIIPFLMGKLPYIVVGEMILVLVGLFAGKTIGE